MFHPSSNRLAGFLEISALSVSLAQSGGVQYKAGYLKAHGINNSGGSFGRKGLGWKAKQESRWAAVRESYLVVVSELGEVSFHLTSASHSLTRNSLIFGMFSFLILTSRSNVRKDIIARASTTFFTTKLR